MIFIKQKNPFFVNTKNKIFKFIYYFMRKKNNILLLNIDCLFVYLSMYYLAPTVYTCNIKKYKWLFWNFIINIIIFNQNNAFYLLFCCYNCFNQYLFMDFFELEINTTNLNQFVCPCPFKMQANFRKLYVFSMTNTLRQK